MNSNEISLGLEILTIGADDQSRTKVFCHDFSSPDQLELPFFFMKFSIKTMRFIFTFPNNYCDFQVVKDTLKSIDE